MQFPTLALSVCVILCFTNTQAALQWVKEWDFSSKFDKLGHSSLMCDENAQVKTNTGCCVCRTIMNKIEETLDKTENDHDIDVVFRLSEEKKTIKFSRSEARILDVLETVCPNVVLEAPDKEDEKKFHSLIRDACHRFVQVFEDDISAIFYDNHEPNAHSRLCFQKLQLCDKPAGHDEL